MRTEEIDFIIYNKDDIVQCPDCLKLLSINDFTPVVPNWGFTIKGKYHRPTYYHCCNKNNAIVFDVGDGSPMRLVAGKIMPAKKE